MLSVVIPTLNAAAGLAETIGALGLGSGPVDEVVVADGGSSDGTPDLARRLGAIVAGSARGRGTQLAEGARRARHDWLLFLHADTVLQPGWSQAVARFMAEADSAGRAATFRFALDDAAGAARRLERMVAWRSRRLGLPYGDQGLLIHRALYSRIGGFRAMPLMEDVDIVRRIGRRRLVLLDAVARTSAVRYRAGGYLLRPLRNLGCLGLYFLGVPPRAIAWLYR